MIRARDAVLPLIRTAMVAPITSKIRGLPSEVIVGDEEGLKDESAVNLDHVQTVDQRGLRQRIGMLSEAKMQEVCRALAVAAGCA